MLLVNGTPQPDPLVLQTGTRYRLRIGKYGGVLAANGIGVTFQDARPPCQNTVRNLSSSHLPKTEPSAEFSKISSVSLRQSKTLRQSHYKASGSRRSSLASDWLKMPLRTKA